MARNEEKQQGRLNRLWLQKEREEGRLKDVRERRPKLSTLNTASSVKKWIPSIKKEIEYYLQQSQLSHYPERKIAEFQLRIEALEKEYKRFITKLRVLDPSCKHKPWTPRAYLKKRADTQECPTNDINPRAGESHRGSSQYSTGESDLASSGTGTLKSSDTEEPLSFSETRFQTLVPTNLASETSESVCPAQDQPLAFDQTRLAVAAAAFRGASLQISSSQTQRLASLLQSGLPNLSNSPLRTQTFSSQNGDRENNDGATDDSAVGQRAAIQEKKLDCDAADRIPGKSSNSEEAEERTGHVLGLDCYSSSDEDCDA
uniref:Si:dkey-86e18.1 n=1 Tax=Acanthochromis polyacanthus TaxID=80966 RepID=A0A3Q1EBR2_9TELE